MPNQLPKQTDRTQPGSWRATGMTQSRVNLDLTLLDEETTDILKDLDEWLIQYGCKNKETLFKGAKTDQQIRET